MRLGTYITKNTTQRIFHLKGQRSSYTQSGSEFDKRIHVYSSCPASDVFGNHQVGYKKLKFSCFLALRLLQELHVHSLLPNSCQALVASYC